MLHADRCFCGNLWGKIASLLQETALCKRGKMVSKTDHTFDTLRSGEAPNIVDF